MGKAMLIDLNRCIGCRGCQISCKQWNMLPFEKTSFFAGPGYQNPEKLSAFTWTLVLFLKEKIKRGKITWNFIKIQCMHCANASCIMNCPVDAPKKSIEGFTIFREDRCIGCGTCVEVCPYNVPHLTGMPGEEGTKSVKCDFCLSRVRDGKIPACAKSCPTEALEYGERDELIKKGHRIRAKRGGIVYGESEMGGLSMIYVLPKGRVSEYKLVKDPKPKKADIAMLKKILRSINRSTLTFTLLELTIKRLMEEDRKL